MDAFARQQEAQAEHDKGQDDPDGNTHGYSHQHESYYETKARNGVAVLSGGVVVVVGSSGGGGGCLDM